MTDHSSELKLTYFSIAKAAKAQAKAKSNDARRPLASDVVVCGAGVVQLAWLELAVQLTVVGAAGGIMSQTPEFRVYPALHDAQMAAPSVMQAAPVAATPFEQVHVLAEHAEPANMYPALHDAQMAALFVVQAAPVAATPFEQ